MEGERRWMCGGEGPGGGCCAGDGGAGWLRVAVGAFIGAQAMTFGLAINLTPPEEEGVRWLVQGILAGATGVVAALLGWPLARAAWRELRCGRVTMELLFIAGVAGAAGLSAQAMIGGRGPVYFETVCVLLIVYSVGRAIGEGSQRRALRSMRTLTEPIATARRASANSLEGSGERVAVERIAAGDRVSVLPGELIPVDGRIVRGMSMVAQTPFTGEWVSTVRREGEMVLAGTACEDGALVIEATVAGTERRVDELARLIEEARQRPTHLQRQADQLVRIFLPVVFGVCAATVIGWTWAEGWAAGLFNGMSVLLVACPCAAGLAAPLAIWTAIGRLAEGGLLVRSGDALERLAGVDGVIFDKTGTLGDERLQLRSIATPQDPQKRSLALAAIAAVERCSDHPVARALREVPQAAEAPDVGVEWVRVLSGRGIEARIRHGAEGQLLRIIRDEDAAAGGKLKLHATLDGEWAATMTLAEQIRETAGEAVERLKKMGLVVWIMTGDSAAGAHSAEHLAPVLAGMTAGEKLDAVGRLQAEERWPMRRPVFVGDGMNDAAAMGAAHASIALSSGSSVTVETASAVLRGADLRMVAEGIEVSRRAVRTIRSNFLWAAGYNTAGMAVAAAGWLHPVAAAVLMGLSSVVVAWRSRVAGSAARQGDQRDAATPALREEESGATWWMPHWAGIVGQGVALGGVAGLDWGGWAAVIAAFAAGAWWIARRGARGSEMMQMTLGMVSVGGLGMAAGWWADNAFGPDVRHACCASSVWGSVAGSPWMYFGMLAMGVPAMFVVRTGAARVEWKGCGRGMLLLGIPGMVVGMWAGSAAWAWLGWSVSPSAFALANYGFMMTGMVLGMLVPHEIERWTRG